LAGGEQENEIHSFIDSVFLFIRALEKIQALEKEQNNWALEKTLSNLISRLLEREMVGGPHFFFFFQFYFILFYFILFYFILFQTKQNKTKFLFL